MDDATLMKSTEELAADERAAEADLLAHISEVERRRLAEARGYANLYLYCVQKLKFGEAMAYWRMQAARAARDHPVLLDLVEAGELNVCTVKLIAPYLGMDQGRANEVIQAARGKSKRDVEAIIAGLSPSAPRRDVVVKCGPVVMAKAQWPEPAATAPEPVGGPPGAAAEQRTLDVVEAIDAERRRLHFDVGPDTAQLLERAREILRHKFPFASLEDIVREALNVLLDEKDLDRSDLPADGTPGGGAPGSRNIPMWVRRAVWRRDGGRCVFVGGEGKTCGERSWLEFDHVVPFARGGRSDDPANVRLLCRAHNRTAADQAFGVDGGAGGAPASA